MLQLLAGTQRAPEIVTAAAAARLLALRLRVPWAWGEPGEEAPGDEVPPEIAAAPAPTGSASAIAAATIAAAAVAAAA